MTYHPRQEGQAVQKHRLKTKAGISRIVGTAGGKKQRTKIVFGDEFHPTPGELRAFGGKMEVVVENSRVTFDTPVAPAKKAPSAPAPLTPADSGNSGGDSGGSGDSGDSGAEKKDDTKPPVLTQADFASVPAMQAWIKAGSPAMTVPKTGNNATQWSKKDVEAQEKLAKA